MSTITPSVITSIFKRKGGEGKYTRIISPDLKTQNNNIVLSILEEGEEGLILYYKNEMEWFLISNRKIRFNYDGVVMDMGIDSVEKVSLALEEEYRDGVKDKMNFSRLKLTIKAGQTFLLTFEKGKPFQGIYQVLHYLSHLD